MLQGSNLHPRVDRPAGGSIGVVALQARVGPVQPTDRPEGEVSSWMTADRP